MNMVYTHVHAYIYLPCIHTCIRMSIYNPKNVYTLHYTHAYTHLYEYLYKSLHKCLYKCLCRISIHMVYIAHRHTCLPPCITHVWTTRSLTGLPRAEELAPCATATPTTCPTNGSRRPYPNRYDSHDAIDRRSTSLGIHRRFVDVTTDVN